MKNYYSIHLFIYLWLKKYQLCMVVSVVISPFARNSNAIHPSRFISNEILLDRMCPPGKAIM